MRRLILESLEPNNTDKYPIKTKQYDGITYQFGLRGNMLVYKSDIKDASKEWMEFRNNDLKYTIKKELYGLEPEDSIFDQPNTNTKTKGKCSPLTTSPEGLTLNITNPGDKNYIYGKVGQEWFAQNIKNKRIFNLTKCNYTTSIAKLEKLKPGSTKVSVEDLKNQSMEIQKSVGLPQTGSFDIESLEKLITFLSDEGQLKQPALQQTTGQ